MKKKKKKINIKKKKNEISKKHEIKKNFRTQSMSVSDNVSVRQCQGQIMSGSS